MGTLGAEGSRQRVPKGRVAQGHREELRPARRVPRWGAGQGRGSACCSPFTLCPSSSLLAGGSRGQTADRPSLPSAPFLLRTGVLAACSSHNRSLGYTFSRGAHGAVRGRRCASFPFSVPPAPRGPPLSSLRGLDAQSGPVSVTAAHGPCPRLPAETLRHCQPRGRKHRADTK